MTDHVLSVLTGNKKKQYIMCKYILLQNILIFNLKIIKLNLKEHLSMLTLNHFFLKID